MATENSQAVDARYSLGLLEKMNGLTVGGVPVHEFFTIDRYSDWTFQQPFLLTQIREFSRTRDLEVYKKSKRPRFPVLSRIVMWSESFAFLCASVIGFAYGVLLRPRVVLFCSDFLKPNSALNPRLSTVTEYLREQRVPFVEILHVTTARNFFRNSFRRGHPALYLESLKLAAAWACFLRGTRRRESDEFKKISFDAFDANERAFAELLAREAIRNIHRGRETVKLLSGFLRATSAGLFISIDDVRYTGEILLACERSKIPSHLFQHSNFDYLVGLDTLPPHTYVFPTQFAAWNTYWSRRIAEISPLFSFYRERIRIGGRAYAFTPPKQIARRRAAGESRLMVLLPYEVAVQKQHIQPYLDKLLADARIHTLFVLRGDYDRDAQVTQYFGRPDFAHPGLTIVGAPEREKAISSADVVAGVYSGFLDEAIELGIPVCIFDTEYVNINRLDLDGLAVLVEKSNHDIFERLSEAKNTDEAILRERKRRISEGAGSAREYLARIL